MCNRYASDIRKAGLEREFYGFEEWSDTRIPCSKYSQERGTNHPHEK